MNRLTVLLATLLNELASQLSLCADRDTKYIVSRVEHEGLSFLTITLPEFSASLLEAIELGRAQRSMFPHFAAHRSRYLPKFLSGFTSRVFDSQGVLRHDADPDSIYAIRQICDIFKKLRLDCSRKRQSSAIASYKANEEFLFHDRARRHRLDPVFDRVCNLIIFSSFPAIDIQELRPRHGPGATADRLRHNARRRIRQWFDRSEESFPSADFILPNYSWYNDLREVKYLKPQDEPPVRVVFVPKTLKTPRVIAIEPHNVQFCQQALMNWYVKRVSESPLMRDSIQFSDQSINRDAAQRSSIDRSLCTIDMKDASDLVSLDLVQRVFRTSPILPYLEDSRSLSAALPDGTSVILQKFASMGSAMCFPIEATVFYCLIQTAIHRHHGIFPTADSIRLTSKSIKIFGDDIIIPSYLQEVVTTELESYSLKVNRRKSFSRSHFRESCGGDFYKGYPVRPAYLREVIPDGCGRWPARTLASVVAFSNQLYELGCWRTTQLLRSWIERTYKIEFPISVKERGVLSFRSVRGTSYNGWNKDLNSYSVRGLKVLPRRVSDDISNDAVASMFKAFENIGNDTSVDLETSVRPQSLVTKVGWSR